MKVKLKILLLTVVLFIVSCIANKVYAATYENLTYTIDNSSREITINGCAKGATYVEIPEEIEGFKVTSIDYQAFKDCTSLKEIKIPSSITYISREVFSGCTSLENVDIANGIKYLNTKMFENCTSLEKITIPSSVTEIKEGTFFGCTNLKNVTIPSSVIKIYNEAFANCTSIENIVLPTNLKTIEGSAFENCTSLKEIEIPMTVDMLNIGLFLNGAFSGCTSLSKITLPHTLTQIDTQTFYNISPDAVFYVVENSLAHLYAINNDFKTEFYTTPITQCSIKGVTDKTYTGYKLTQNLQIKYGGYTLENGTDYITSYENNENAGTATVKIEGRGAFSGSVTKEFKINPKNISTCSSGNIKTQIYIAKNIEPGITIKNGKNVLEEDKDYKTIYKNNKNPGKATVEIKGIGNYTGSITKSFTIEIKKVTGLKTKTQTTTSITLSWTKVQAVSGYEIQRYDSSKKKWQSVATTSKTTYTVKKQKQGTTYKYRVKAYKTISNKKYYGSYSDTLTTTTKTATPKISRIASKNRKATINWSKVSGASGYEIYMATSKNGKYKKVKTAIGGTKVKYTRSGLTKGRTYYFKIRTYRTVNKKKVYSSYSVTKGIKVK